MYAAEGRGGGRWWRRHPRPRLPRSGAGREDDHDKVVFFLQQISLSHSVLSPPDSIPSLHMAGRKGDVIGIGDLAGGTLIPPSPSPSLKEEVRLESWRGAAPGGWATALVLLFLSFWQLLRSVWGRRRLRLWQPPVGAFSTTKDAGPMRRRPVDGTFTFSSSSSSSSGISEIICEEDLKILIKNLEGNFNDVDRWEDVIDKKNDKMSYTAKCCKPKDGPLRYLSVTTFEKCSVEVLKDFYMDNEYRKEWDKTLVDHEQLEIDVASGTEIGRTIKKFPLLSRREYVLSWRVWEGKNKTFYCFIKDCEHPLAPRQKKYVRVRSFRSGWRIRKVPDRDACEIKMVHQEDAGLNTEMAKLAFAKGIWSYVCKMNGALHEYSCRSLTHSTSGATSLRLIQVPPGLEGDCESSGGSGGGDTIRQVPAGGPGGGEGDESAAGKNVLKKPSRTWIAKGLLVIGGIVCLSRGHSALGTQLAMACILKKLVRHGGVSSSSRHAEPARLSRGRRGHRHRN